MYIGLGIVLLVIGAIFAFGVITVDIPGVAQEPLGWIFIAAGLLAIVLSFAIRARSTGGHTTIRESNVDPVSGERIERTDVDPR